MSEKLKIGEHPKNTYWTVRGDTGVPAHHIDKFYKCGTSFHEYKGTVWVICSLKILRPFDTVTKDHIELFEVYDNYKLNEKPTPEEEYNGPLPFSTYGIVDYTAMALVGGDGPRSTWSHEWKNGLLHVYNDEGEKIHKPYGNNVAPCDSGLSGPVSVPVSAPIVGSVPISKSVQDPKTKNESSKPDKPISSQLNDDDNDDDTEMYDLFA
jgi:hypothetical protein